MVSWSASNGHYCLPDVQTPDLHCSTRQYSTTLVSLFIIFRNHCESLDQQTTQHSSHYQLARTHICSHFSHRQLPIETNCHVNSAWNWNHQLTPCTSLCTVHRLINRHPSHDAPAVMGWCSLLDNRQRTEELVNEDLMRQLQFHACTDVIHQRYRAV